jgi:DNA repair exonuclease SbcCD ATPase subunit
VLKLKELRFSGIGRFTEEQTIDFTKLGNLVQVDGKNNNTGGSSGAGKSTIFNALDYLFGVNDLPATVLKSRVSESGINVQGSFDLDGKSLVITRGKKLKVDFDGDIVEGNSKLSEEKLDHIISVPRDVFRPMFHKRQKEGGFFLNFTPQKMNDFLVECLGLGDLKQKLEIVDKKIKDLTDKKLLHLAALENAKTGQNATESAIAALVPPVKDIHQKVILDLKKKYESAANELAAIVAKHKIENEALELERPKVSLVPFDSTAADSYRAQIDEIQKKINQFESQEKDRLMEVNKQINTNKLAKMRLEEQIRQGKKAMEEASSIAAEIKKIQSNKCPTCDQDWQLESAKLREAALLEKIKKLREDVVLGKSAEQQVNQINDYLADLTNQLTPLKNVDLFALQSTLGDLSSSLVQERQKEKVHQQEQEKNTKAVLDVFAVKQRELASRQALESNQVAGQVEVTRRALDAAVSKLKAYTEAQTRYESSLKNLQIQLDQFSQKVSENLTYWQNLKEELVLAEEVKRAIKSYISCSFDDALEYIGDAATKLIRNIPTMANSTVQLEGIKETKEGKIKEEVNAVISMDGEIGIPIKSLSGGERSSVDLAVDLAVVDLLENKTSKGIDIFILDEPFDGLDTIGIEMALEVLKNSNINKKLVIVDHNPEVKEMVESRLVVVRDGVTSTVVQS